MSMGEIYVINTAVGKEKRVFVSVSCYTAAPLLLHTIRILQMYSSKFIHSIPTWALGANEGRRLWSPNLWMNFAEVPTLDNRYTCAVSSSYGNMERKCLLESIIASTAKLHEPEIN